VTRAVILDLGQVLVPFDWQRGYRALAAHCPLPPEEVRRRIKEAGLFNDFERGRIEPRDLAARLCQMLGMDLPYETFREIWSSIFSPQVNLSPESLETIRAGRRLLLLSNTDPIHFGWIGEKYDLLQHFDHCVVSFETGTRKPEPAIYFETLRRAECQPGEAFFADDIAENVEAARQLGIDAVQFVSVEQLAADLAKRGICW
jgi:putative hydrolase of the HAD superfamily